MISRCVASVLFFLAWHAPAAESAWLVPDAVLRASFRATKPPTVTEAGWLLELPELGATTADLRDVVLMDANGTQLPVAKVFRSPGDRVFLLAQNLAKDQQVSVYFGGMRERPDLKWTPRLSLFLETRRLPDDAQLDDWPHLETAWNSATAVDGAGFVPTIAHAENPFGESAAFLSHFAGYLRVPEKKVTLYTISSDASFVLANDRLSFGWPGKHPPQTNEMTAPRGEIAVSDGVLKIDYYHAKAGSGPTMMLGWIRDGRLEAIPPDAWVQPGGTEQISLEHHEGWPIAQPNVRVTSHLGFGGSWLFETTCSLKTPPPDGWKVRWEWSDGAVADGVACTRICVGPTPLRVTVHLAQEGRNTSSIQQVRFNGQIPQASIGNTADVRRYLAVLETEDPNRLNGATLGGVLPFIAEFGTDQLFGRFGAAWMAQKCDPENPLWIAAHLARLRALAQKDPEAALAELRNFDLPTRQKFPQLAMLELDVLVFGMKSTDAVALAERINSEHPDKEEARIARIRVADLHRLQGRAEEAKKLYEALSGVAENPSQPLRRQVVDSALSFTIDERLERGDRHAAVAELRDWELSNPLAKYESDYLLLQTRTLLRFGRWREALAECESFLTIRTDPDWQYRGRFFRAHAMTAEGRTDEAKKVWTALAAENPKHPLAGEAANLAK